jgi:hypothetical protein
VGNRSAKGFIRITRIHPITGKTTTIEYKPNTILYQGADIMAMALAGVQNSPISHFYIAYNDTTGDPFPSYSIQQGNTTMLAGDHYGYLKVPLTYPASYLSETNYSNNIVVFTVLLSNPGSYAVSPSVPFADGVEMFEVSLVSASTNGDKIFSRAQFTPIAFDSSHNITISWGIKFITD